MYPRRRRRSGFWFTLRKRRTFAQKRSISLPVLETSSESDGQRERRWPLHFCEFYNGRSPLWSHGKHFPRPGRSTMAIWNGEEYVVVNLTDKIDYVRAEICKFNPCLCISSSSTGIIYFFHGSPTTKSGFPGYSWFFFLTVFFKKLVKIENIVTRTFSIQLVILLPF